MSNVDSNAPKKSLVVIPARMAASRFPGKPMAKLLGMPMIGHIVRRSLLATRADCTYVATCDQEIYDYVVEMGAKAVMTSDRHERATERVAEALLKIEGLEGQRFDVVAMVQGDEPTIDPAMINTLIEGLTAPAAPNVLNLMVKIENEAEFIDPNAVKTVIAPNGDALYFSREPIPSAKKGDRGPRYKQLGMIGFQRDYLLRYVELAPTPLEIAESVDMNRVLEHGDRVRMRLVEARCLAVDRPEDVTAVEAVMRHDQWLPRYLSE